MNTKRFHRWAEFHAEHPEVFALFERFAFELIRAGKVQRFGARLIWERMRWETKVGATDGKWKLNDHYPPYYARLFMQKHPEHEGVFETRDKAARASRLRRPDREPEPTPEPKYETDEHGQALMFGRELETAGSTTEHDH